MLNPDAGVPLLSLPPRCVPSPGYPWIDAIMTQLRQWGWMHHLARHCVACFLTRGDLYVSWEKGKDVFEEYLIDQVGAGPGGELSWASGAEVWVNWRGSKEWDLHTSPPPLILLPHALAPAQLLCYPTDAEDTNLLLRKLPN